MDFQTGFNIAAGLAGFLGGWVLNSLKASIDQLHKADDALTDKVQRIEVLVAGEYVKRDDLDKLTAALFVKLDKIYELLEKKADK